MAKCFCLRSAGILLILYLILVNLSVTAIASELPEPETRKIDTELPGFIEKLPRTTLRYYTTKPALTQFEVGGLIVSLNLILVDEPIYKELRSRDPFPREVWSSVSLIGEPSLHLAMGAVGGLLEADLGEDLFFASLYNGINTTIIKVSTGMARPSNDQGVVFQGISFDRGHMAMVSGHTSSAFAVAGVLAEHFPEWKPVLYLAAGAVGLSRIFLGEHWLSNVVLGALVGHISTQHYLQLKEEGQP